MGVQGHTRPMPPFGSGRTRGHSGPGSRWLRGPGLRPVGASGPLLFYTRRRLGGALRPRPGRQAAEPDLPLGPAGAPLRRIVVFLVGISY
jgi:hypothetical protein